jgi:hypothetical protein
VDFALYRRIIEIRDGHVALRPYFLSGTPDWVAEMVGVSPDGAPSNRAVVEAATIVAALESRRTGRGLGDGGSGAAHAVQAVPRTVEAEADWLLEVTDAFLHSSVMEHVRRRARDGECRCPATRIAPRTSADIGH